MTQGKRQVIVINLVLAFFFAAISYAAGKKELGDSYREGNRNRYAVMDLIHEPFQQDDSFLGNLGALMGKYIDRRCNNYNLKMFGRLGHGLGTFNSTMNYPIKSSLIGMASINAFQKLIDNWIDPEPARPKTVNSRKSRLEKDFDVNFMFTLKEIRPIFSCKFQVLDKLNFQAYVSPLEAKSRARLYIPIGKYFNLELKHRVSVGSLSINNIPSIKDLTLNSVVSFRATIAF